MDSWVIRVGIGAVAIVTASGLVYRLVWTKDVKKPVSKIEEIPIQEVGNKLAGLRDLCKAGKSPDLWNTAIFFPCYFPDEEPDGSFARLVYYISSAEVSLKICVMTLKYRRLLKVIIAQHTRGVKVQVFTSNMCGETGVAGKELRPKGIPVRHMGKTAYCTIMHHKYAIVDDLAILTGSMNWTNVSVTQQRENIMITTDPRIVPKFVSHFDTLWEENPYPYTDSGED